MTLPHELGALLNLVGICSKAARSYTYFLAVCRWQYVTDVIVGVKLCSVRMSTFLPNGHSGFGDGEADHLGAVGRIEPADAASPSAPGLIPAWPRKGSAGSCHNPT